MYGIQYFESVHDAKYLVNMYPNKKEADQGRKDLLQIESISEVSDVFKIKRAVVEASHALIYTKGGMR